ncbi:zinc finger ccch domain-containing protein [Anaeramoeba flamelloides]|uniref:Zinc finger ccch domain-containing protein n=1 Tax=Anaeramoeba flamelloides TaxID=1746091 RepID=A0AAV8A726_9EUKA|nr:zinc finger ccch domain-containing protein [Anaeramoeba flamelloides]
MSNDDPRMKCKTCSKEIKYYCQTCTTSYCETHFNETHNKDSPHDFIYIFPNSFAETIFCSKHESYFYDMYCNDCKQLICKMCRSEDHSGHNTVTLEKAKEAILNSIDPETTQLNINSIVSSNVGTKDDLEGMVSEVKTGFDSTKGLIEQRSQVLTRLIQRQKKDTVSEVERNEDKKQITLSRQKHSESTISQQLNTFLEKCEQANDAEEEEDQISFVHYAWKALSLNFEEINEKKSLFPNTLPGSNWSFSHSKQLESLTNLKIITPIEIMFTKVHLPKMVILPNKCEFQIELRNAEGSIIYADIDPVFEISCHVKDQVIDNIKVTRNPKTGIYEGQTTLPTPGDYELKININGIQLPNKVEPLDKDIDIIEKSEIDGFEDEFNLKDEDKEDDDDDDDFNKINELLQKTERLGLSGNLDETKGFDLKFIAKAQYKLSNCVIKPPNVLICGEGESFSIKLKNKSDKTLNPGYDVNFNIIVDCPNGKQDKIEMIKSETSKGLYVGNLKYNSRGLYEMNVKLDNVIFQDSPYIFWVAHHEDKFQLPKNLPMLATKSKKKIAQKINRKQLAETIFFNDKLTVINPGLFENNITTVLGSTRLKVGKKYHYKFRIDKLGSKIRSSSHLEIGIGQYIEKGEITNGGRTRKKVKKTKKSKSEESEESEESEKPEKEKKKEKKKSNKKKKESKLKKDKKKKKEESEESEEQEKEKEKKKSKKKEKASKKEKEKKKKKPESEESEEQEKEKKKEKKKSKVKKDKKKKKEESEESEEPEKEKKKSKKKEKASKKEKEKKKKKPESEESEEQKKEEKKEPKIKKEKKKKKPESEESKEPEKERKKKTKKSKKSEKKKRGKEEKKGPRKEKEKPKPEEEKKGKNNKDKTRKKKNANETEELRQVPTRLWLYDCGNATKIHNNKTTKFGSKAKEGDIVEMVVDLNHGTLLFGIDKEAKMSNMEMNCELFPTAFKNITNDAIIVVRLYKNNDSVSFVKSLGSTPLMPRKKDRKSHKSKHK